VLGSPGAARCRIAAKKNIDPGIGQIPLPDRPCHVKVERTDTHPLVVNADHAARAVQNQIFAAEIMVSQPDVHTRWRQSAQFRCQLMFRIRADSRGECQRRKQRAIRPDFGASLHHAAPGDINLVYSG
jgi:hypothetical protein